jgi:hypothetical protein
MGEAGGSSGGGERGLKLIDQSGRVWPSVVRFVWAARYFSKMVRVDVSQT